MKPNRKTHYMRCSRRPPKAEHKAITASAAAIRNAFTTRINDAKHATSYNTCALLSERYHKPIRTGIAHQANALQTAQTHPRPKTRPSLEAAASRTRRPNTR